MLTLFFLHLNIFFLQIHNFSDRVRRGEWRGVTGKPLTSVVSIGIGGSYLGPEFVYEALRTDPEGIVAAEGRTLRFLANVDPVDTTRALAGLDPETTLVIIVSKVHADSDDLAPIPSVFFVWSLSMMLFCIQPMFLRVKKMLCVT